MGEEGVARVLLGILEVVDDAGSVVAFELEFKTEVVAQIVVADSHAEGCLCLQFASDDTSDKPDGGKIVERLAGEAVGRYYLGIGATHEVTAIDEGVSALISPDCDRHSLWYDEGEAALVVGGYVPTVGILHGNAVDGEGHVAYGYGGTIVEDVAREGEDAAACEVDSGVGEAFGRYIDLHCTDAASGIDEIDAVESLYTNVVCGGDVAKIRYAIARESAVGREWYLLEE